jgi:hypothetical protein
LHVNLQSVRTREHATVAAVLAGIAIFSALVLWQPWSDRMDAGRARAVIRGMFPTARVRDVPDVDDGEAIVARVSRGRAVADVLVATTPNLEEGAVPLGSAERHVGGRWEPMVGCHHWAITWRDVRGGERATQDLELRVESAIRNATPADARDCQG